MTRLLSAIPPWTRRLTADLALWAAIGVVMAFLGPFQTANQPLAERFVYWLCCMVGGGIIGILVDAAVLRWVRRFWPRLLMVSGLMTPPVAALVGLVQRALYGRAVTGGQVTAPLFQVFIVCFAAMCLRQLVWSSPAGIEPAAPETPSDPTETFRRRLSARRREAAIYAVEAEDHYLRVHTDAGQELIAGRFADALEELREAPGFRTHRSWWVAAAAIDQVRWRRGGGEVRLVCGLEAPVSRTHAPALKQAGWF